MIRPGQLINHYASALQAWHFSRSLASRPAPLRSFALSSAIQVSVVPYAVHSGSPSASSSPDDRPGELLQFDYARSN